MFEGDYLNILWRKHCFPVSPQKNRCQNYGVPVVASSSITFINRVLSKWAVKYASLGVAKEFQAKRAYIGTKRQQEYSTQLWRETVGWIA